MNEGNAWIQGKTENPIQSILNEYRLPNKISTGLQKIYRAKEKGPVGNRELFNLQRSLYDEGFLRYQEKMKYFSKEI